MKNTERKEAEVLLAKLTKGMNIPEHRLTDVRWLARNLDSRNASHKNYENARNHIMTMVQKGWV